MASNNAVPSISEQDSGIMRKIVKELSMARPNSLPKVLNALETISKKSPAESSTSPQSFITILSFLGAMGHAFGDVCEDLKKKVPVSVTPSLPTPAPIRSASTSELSQDPTPVTSNSPATSFDPTWNPQHHFDPATDHLPPNYPPHQANFPSWATPPPPSSSCWSHRPVNQFYDDTFVQQRHPSWDAAPHCAPTPQIPAFLSSEVSSARSHNQSQAPSTPDHPALDFLGCGEPPLSFSVERRIESHELKPITMLSTQEREDLRYSPMPHTSPDWMAQIDNEEMNALLLSFDSSSEAVHLQEEPESPVFMGTTPAPTSVSSAAPGTPPVLPVVHVARQRPDDAAFSFQRSQGAHKKKCRGWSEKDSEWIPPLDYRQRRGRDITLRPRKTINYRERE